MPRKGHPDYAVDPDRGSSASPTKNARLVDLDEHQDRAASRSGLRDLDAMTEGMSGLTRMQKAVSYTHLDVYKRQGVKGPIRMPPKT